MTKFTDKVITDARDNYLACSSVPPEQFNVAYCTDSGWTAEFHENEGCWSEGFVTWMSGKDALALFFSCDAESVDLQGWEESYND